MNFVHREYKTSLFLHTVYTESSFKTRTSANTPPSRVTASTQRHYVNDSYTTTLQSQRTKSVRDFIHLGMPNLVFVFAVVGIFGNLGGLIWQICVNVMHMPSDSFFTNGCS